jgi:hypothetical protein
MCCAWSSEPKDEDGQKRGPRDEPVRRQNESPWANAWTRRAVGVQWGTGAAAGGGMGRAFYEQLFSTLDAGVTVKETDWVSWEEKFEGRSRDEIDWMG